MKHKLIALLFTKKTKLECDKVLSVYSPYYQNLSKVNKYNFQIRTLLFIRTTTFNSTQGFVVNNKMKIIISSAFAQLTFGLKTDTLKVFNNIFITPQPYSYKNNAALFDGDVNLHTKKINMSWPAIERGFKIPDDALNLCIHEFGHCLIFENTSRSYLSKIFKKKDFNNWRKHAEVKLEKVKSNDNKVLRDYAGTNLVELFSVSLETFFEQAEYFEENEPLLYFSTTKLLKQDPRNKTNPIL
ncbi:zinc-dependent peptidase [Algibacter sp. L1A34]|uniref:zinc-dependent peptidase n=1 Tax=Algibacter sp. L1A34 TaxID=2686365 RepID=UPI00293BB81B|nr:zinc-dependent peptidase [Algibacter sp. L1A34]